MSTWGRQTSSRGSGPSSPGRMWSSSSPSKRRPWRAFRLKIILIMMRQTSKMIGGAGRAFLRRVWNIARGWWTTRSRPSLWYCSGQRQGSCCRRWWWTGPPTSTFPGARGGQPGLFIRAPSPAGSSSSSSRNGSMSLYCQSWRGKSTGKCSSEIIFLHTFRLLW